jgi:mannose-1-phosphate guanylyltransferase
MKAFLLAAGRGTRLRPLTDNIPKCLLPIRGIPLLEIWLELCRNAGIKEILINIHAHAAQVTDCLRRSSNGLHVRVVKESQLLGSAGTLIANREWVASEERFWVFYGDVLTRADLNSMRRFHDERRPVTTLGVCHVPDPTRCGIVTVTEDNVVREFVEKPKNSESSLAFAGLMIATRQLLDAIPQKLPADIGFDVLPRLTGSMLAYHISEYLIDIGTLENYEAAQNTWPGL